MEDSNKLLSTVMVGVVGIIGISLIIKLIREKRREKSGERLTTDENVRIAMELNTAIHPGRSWISDIFISANKDEIFRLGGYINNFEDISREYKNLYRESLSHELQDALGDDYTDFINMIKKVESGTNIISDSEAQILAKEMEAEMTGLNWFGRDLTPFNNLLRLTDNNFKKVIETYNAKFSESFIKTLEGEYAMSFAGSIFLKEDVYWRDVAKKITSRYYLIF